MNALLEIAIEAHGGLRRWRQLTSITASLSFAGPMLNSKGWEGALEQVVVSVDTHIQSALIGPFTAPDRRGLFTSNRVAIETSEGRSIDVRSNPRAAFEANVIESPWDALGLAYFTGCAMWTALTAPFLMNEPGFVTDELDLWHEDGETWRRLHCVFPERVACHNRNQVFYFGPDGLLRRHDYNLDVGGGVPIADYTDDHQVFGGISFPTLRRAVRRLPDGLSEPEPALFAIDIANVTVASHA